MKRERARPIRNRKPTYALESTEKNRAIYSLKNSNEDSLIKFSFGWPINGLAVKKECLFVHLNETNIIIPFSIDLALHNYILKMLLPINPHDNAHQRQ